MIRASAGESNISTSLFSRSRILPEPYLEGRLTILKDASRSRRAVLRAMAQYNPTAIVVIGPDFGHTDPQWVLPYGGNLTVDGPAEAIIAHY